jgi:hypothetical protein
MRWRSLIGEFGSVTGELITKTANKSNQLFCGQPNGAGKKTRGKFPVPATCPDGATGFV